MTRIHAYLTFNGNCREAMTFYKDCLGGELTLQTVESSPMADEWPTHAQQNILHASLTKDELVLLGSDMAEPGEPVKGNTISLSLTCSTEEETNTFFSNLSAGGQITHPLHEFYGGTLGTLTDKFGMNWLLYYDQKSKE